MADSSIKGNIKNPASRYQLRKAAGRYWLIDMEQPGFPYVPPVVINEGGAFIWQAYARGLSVNAIADMLGNEYKIPAEEALQDVLQFSRQLEEQCGVIIRQDF